MNWAYKLLRDQKTKPVKTQLWQVAIYVPIVIIDGTETSRIHEMLKLLNDHGYVTYRAWEVKQ